MRLDLARSAQSTWTEEFSRNQRRVPPLCYLVTREICVHAQNHTAGIYSGTFDEANTYALMFITRQAGGDLVVVMSSSSK
jgi:hypothetical protein